MELQIDETRVIRGRFDGKRAAVVTKIQDAVVCVETEFVFVKSIVLERIRGPQVWRLAIRIEDFCIELASCAYTAVGSLRSALRRYSKAFASEQKLTQHCCR